MVEKVFRLIIIKYNQNMTEILSKIKNWNPEELK